MTIFCHEKKYQSSLNRHVGLHTSEYAVHNLYLLEKADKLKHSKDFYHRNVHFLMIVPTKKIKSDMKCEDSVTVRFFDSLIY